MHCTINSQDMVHESLEGEVVIVNLKNGRYYSLMGTASMVWSRIEEGRSKEQIEAELHSSFRDEDGQIAPTLSVFFQALSEEGLVFLEPGEDEPAPAPVNPSPDAPAFQPFSINKHVDMEGLLLLDPVHDVSEQGWPAKKAVES